MFSTLRTLTAIQWGRTLALPAKLIDNMPRTLALGSIQRRNAALDALFYDISKVHEDELAELSIWLAREGALLIVPPTGKGMLSVHLDKADFLAAGGRGVAALAVAGVGSSALGSAAFARNVADALDAPVAAVVSGYGLSDVLTEALGGFFWFGGLNSLRHGFEGLDRLTKHYTISEPALDAADGVELLRLSKDTATLIDLLEDPGFSAPVLVGHSKGNLVVSEALYALEAAGTLAPVAARCRIVTFSAKVGMPAAFKGRVFDIIGELDGFGELNSRPDIPADLTLPGKWHSTNPEFPLDMGIDVTAAMREAMARPLPYPVPHVRGSDAYDLPQLLAGSLAA